MSGIINVVLNAGRSGLSGLRTAAMNKLQQSFL